MFGLAVRSTSDRTVSVEGPRIPEGYDFPLDRPCFIAGRSDEASLVLPDRTVSLRHVFVQQINGRLFACDLFSANGTRLKNRRLVSGWWPADTKLAVGPYDLSHRVADTGDDPPSPMDFRPRNDSHPFYEPMPEVSLELVDKSSGGHLWPINRVVTLLGRESRCRISCGDESVSSVHCAFVLTPSGPWVVDLLSRNGIAINGHKVSRALLSDGFELSVGRYRLRSHVGDPPSTSIPTKTTDGSKPDVEFLTRTNRIFRVETAKNSVIILPQGDLQDFLYQDFQQETNVIIRAVTAGKFDHVVIDFSGVRLVGSIMIEALAGFCRAARGKAVMCNASVEMYGALDSMNLPSIWYHYNSRQDAVTAAEFDDESP